MTYGVWTAMRKFPVQRQLVLQLWSLRICITFANCWVFSFFSFLSFLLFGLGIVAVPFKIDYAISSVNHLWAGDWSPLPGDKSCSSKSPTGSGRNKMLWSWPESRLWTLEMFSGTETRWIPEVISNLNHSVIPWKGKRHPCPTLGYQPKRCRNLQKNW